MPNKTFEALLKLASKPAQKVSGKPVLSDGYKEKQTSRDKIVGVSRKPRGKSRRSNA
jgi:hypothetical protein